LLHRTSLRELIRPLIVIIYALKDYISIGTIF